MFIYVRSTVMPFESSDPLEPRFRFPQTKVSKVYQDIYAAMDAAEQDMCDWLDDDEELIRQADIDNPPSDNYFRITYTELRPNRLQRRIAWEVFALEMAFEYLEQIRNNSI